MPASNIDFSVITEVIHFSIMPNADGTLNTNGEGLTPAYTTDLVARAHAALRPALICVGGSYATNFQSAVSNAYLSSFVTHLTNFMAVGGYDGIDVDWEPLNYSDMTLFTNFVTNLRTALNGFSSHKLLTIAVPAGTTPSLVAAVQAEFDQINLMTYDLSGPYSGWVTWYNAPIYNAGLTFPSNQREYVPSIAGTVTNFLAGGIATNLLGIGTTFYGDVWQGGAWTNGGPTQPYQSWTNAPTVTASTYTALMASNFAPSQYHYDANAQAAYFSVTNAQPTNNMFISFNDPRACAATATYARNAGLGGMIIWELTQDHQANKPDPLLQAIKQVLQSPGNLALQRNGQQVSMNFTSAPLGSYQVQWSTNLTVWNPLLTTNVSLTWTGGVIQVTDSLTNQPDRVYRVKTPP